MATASELKAKITKILTIVEYLEDENISVIEKDILLQAIRELYSDILLTRTDVSVDEKPMLEEEKEVEEEAPAEVEEKISEPPVIAIPFDAGEIDFSDLLNVKPKEENAEAQEENIETEAPEENFVSEDVPVDEVPEEETEQVVVEDNELGLEYSEEEDVPAEDIEPEEETEEHNYDFENKDFEGQDSENIDGSDVMEDEPDSDDLDEILNEEQDSEVQDEAIENEEFDTASNLEETITDEEEQSVFEEEPLPEEQEDENVENPIVESQPVEEEFVSEEPVAEEPKSEEVHVEEPVVEAPKEETPVEKEKTETTHITLGEQLGQSRQSSLNDKFASSKPIDLSGSIGLKPISDIKSSIPLGERFRFTRMLFSGNGVAFDSTVAALNEMSSIEEADSYIRANFSWDMDSPVVVDFMNIVRRRYL